MGCLWIRLSGSFICHRRHGCQTVFSQTKNTNFDLFWKTLLWKLLVYVISHADLWVVLCKLDLFYSNAYGTICCNLIHIFFPDLVCRTEKKSGNPAWLYGALASRSPQEQQIRVRIPPGCQRPSLNFAPRLKHDPQGRSYPPGVTPRSKFCHPRGEILCSPLHSSKQ
jgi:hypothetical protein